MRNIQAARLLVFGFAAVISAAPLARAQTEPSHPPAQMELTEVLLQRYLEAEPEIEALLSQAPDSAAETPDPKINGKLEEIAKKHKFANFGQFETVAGNIVLVLEGVDPKSKKYIGPEAELKQQIAELQANANIPAEDKKAELAELNQELKTAAPVKFQNNIALVLKYIDKLAPPEEPQKP